MADEVARLAERLRHEGERTASFFEGLAPNRWDRPVYAAGPGWQVRQILAHFISAEAAYLHFIRQVLAGGPGLPQDFDIDAFNAAEVPQYSKETPAQLLDTYRRTRTQTVDLAASLSPTDLDREGYHPWFGVMKLGWFLRLCYNHNSIHTRDIRRALESGGPLPPAAPSTPPA